ncbi:hypothetical protein [Nocardioides sp. B-3]|uniref:hypothetical protein n=1 Tax=Nocardioides sp. B-3 TaxID=2895565 RepID=UPI0021525A81|nr:hypothetical protein [Nocardioides sp. B-3]UUZ58872.1 hypothetical protein LP418_22840 [Nocardioides sp. B-3]
MSSAERAVRLIERADGIDVPATRVRAGAHEVLVDPPFLDHLLGGDWLGHRVHPVAGAAASGGVDDGHAAGPRRLGEARGGGRRPSC